MNRLIKQIIKFGIVGATAFVIDYLVLYLLVEYIHAYYLLASAISFTVSVIVNYLLSMQFVFKRRNDVGRQKEFMFFVLLSIIGLLINQLIMWITVDKLHIFYMVSKIFSTIIVMVWNFISRKIVLEEK